jgi:hypothetical protein
MARMNGLNALERVIEKESDAGRALVTTPNEVAGSSAGLILLRKLFR